MPRRLLAAAALLLLSTSVPASAQSAENVAVVINDASPDSQRVGEYYARTRGLPASNVFHIRTTTDETIDRDAFIRTIDAPIGLAIRRAGLQDRLLYLVLTRGIPIRVAGTTGLTGAQASVDSELTLLYRRLLGQPTPMDGKVDNPYFLGSRPISDARPFSHREHDIYLVTRIDAFTVDAALALVDRGLAPVKDGQFVLDARGAAGSSPQWFDEAGRRIAAAGQPDRVITIAAGTTPSPPPTAALGYYATAQAKAQAGSRSAGVAFAPGAIAASLASSDARTFHQPPDDWRPSAGGDRTRWFEGTGDPLIGDLIREGATGVAGQVGEAYVLGAVRPEVLFPAYLAGFNLAEAFYLATPTLSWQTIVVGDPLCASFGRMPLTREQLEDGVDAVTELPGLFARRRLALLRAANAALPFELAAVVVRSETLIDRGDRAGARRALESAVALAPGAVALAVALAQLEEEAGDFDNAIARYRRILELQPMNVVALNNLAFALAVRRNAAAEAVPLARRAAELAPRSGNVLDTLGWVEHLAGNDAAAVDALEKAVQLAPGLPEIRLHAATALAAVGRNDRAAAHLKEAVRLDPQLESRDDVRQLGIKLAQ